MKEPENTKKVYQKPAGNGKSDKGGSGQKGIMSFFGKPKTSIVTRAEEDGKQNSLPGLKVEQVEALVVNEISDEEMAEEKQRGSASDLKRAAGKDEAFTISKQTVLEKQDGGTAAGNGRAGKKGSAGAERDAAQRPEKPAGRGRNMPEEGGLERSRLAKEEATMADDEEHGGEDAEGGGKGRKKRRRLRKLSERTGAEEGRGNEEEDGTMQDEIVERGEDAVVANRLPAGAPTSTLPDQLAEGVEMEVAENEQGKVGRVLGSEEQMVSDEQAAESAIEGGGRRGAAGAGEIGRDKPRSGDGLPSKTKSCTTNWWLKGDKQKKTKEPEESEAQRASLLKKCEEPEDRDGSVGGRRNGYADMETRREGQGEEGGSGEAAAVVDDGQEEEEGESEGEGEDDSDGDEALEEDQEEEEEEEEEGGEGGEVAGKAGSKKRSRGEVKPSMVAKLGVKKVKAAAKGAPGVGDGLASLAARHRKFDPKAAADWKPGEPVPFRFLAQALLQISEESGRLAITEILCNVFRTIMATSPNDLLPAVYLAANRVAPPHEGVELGIGDASIIRALAEATGRNEAQVKREYKVSGDLGLVARASRVSMRTMLPPKPLTCSKVLEAFRFIAKESGLKSADKKRERMKQLIVAARDMEPQFIVRLLQGKMRIGLAEQTVLSALAQAAVLQEEEKETEKEMDEGGKKKPRKDLASRLEEAIRIMKHAYSVLPVYEKIIPALQDFGVFMLPEKCQFTLGVPVGPMLAKPTRGVSEILDKLQGIRFTCEYKYDGERAQIHCMRDGSVEIYSRNAERNTGKFPDVIQIVKKAKKDGVSSFVLDAEVVAFDRQSSKILPFQVLSTRARKGVIESDIKVQVCLFAFDLLLLNEEALLQKQLKERRELLYDSFSVLPGEFEFAKSITSDDPEELMAFVNDAVNHNCEGAMIKTLESEATYEPAKRSNNWLKLKKDYMEGIGDSLDLVPIGAFHGRGKRAGVYGAFLLACHDDDNEEYQSICKIGTGFSEVMLEERSASLRQHVVEKPPPYYRFGDTLGVDVWFAPKEVWEIRAADLSISPVHRAANGLVDPTKGIALRFPRFLRVRADKAPEQSTTSEQVADMYRAQKINHHVGPMEED